MRRRCFLSDRAAGVARVICAAVRPRRRGEIRGYNAGVTVIVLCREYFKDENENPHALGVSSLSRWPGGLVKQITLVPGRGDGEVVERAGEVEMPGLLLRERRPSEIVRRV